MSDFIGPGDVVQIKVDETEAYWHVTTISGNGLIAFIQEGTPEYPRKRRQAIETEKLVKQATFWERNRGPVISEK